MQPNQASRIYPEGGHPTIFLAYNGKYEGKGHYDSLIPTAELPANKAHVTAETVPDVELIERVIILNAESPVIAYLLAQGVTPALVAEQTKPTLPKRLQDQCLWVPASIAHTRNRFVYGGVSIMPQLNVLEAGTPRFNALYNQTFVNTSAGQTLVSASTFTAQASAFGGTPAAAAAGAPPTGGGGGGEGNGRGGRSRSPSPPPPGGSTERFSVIASEVSKAELKALMSNNTSLPSAQRDKVLEILGGGRMDSINVKLMSSGNVRMSTVRAGRVGYQRMSFEIDQLGKTIKVVQTAFDENDKLVHQKTGAPKNNLFDVKKWKKPT